MKISMIPIKHAIPNQDLIESQHDRILGLSEKFGGIVIRNDTLVDTESGQPLLDTATGEYLIESA